MEIIDEEISQNTRKWLSAIGKKGGKKGRATPPKNSDGSPGHWVEETKEESDGENLGTGHTGVSKNIH